MPRVIATVTPEIEQAVLEEHKRTGAPISTIVRRALKLYLEENGKEVSADVKWGGVRKPLEPDKQLA